MPKAILSLLDLNNHYSFFRGVNEWMKNEDFLPLVLDQ